MTEKGEALIPVECMDGMLNNIMGRVDSGFVTILVAKDMPEDKTAVQMGIRGQSVSTVCLLEAVSSLLSEVVETVEGKGVPWMVSLTAILLKVLDGKEDEAIPLLEKVLGELREEEKPKIVRPEVV